jgi:sigma-B regulation protein RsbU (phosphoserine phosphatase)
MDTRVLPAAESLYDAAPCALLLAGSGGRILQANATFCQWLGYSRHEALDLQLQALLTMGGRIFWQTHLAPLLRMQGSVAEVKLELRHKSGHTVPMMLNVAERHEGGDVLLQIALFVAEDRHKYEHELLLQRQRAEQLAREQAQGQRELTLAQTRLRLALESANLYVWDVLASTGERRYEDGVARLLGLQQAQPVDPGVYAQAIAAEDRESEAQAFERAMRPDSGAYRCTYRLNGADGEQRTVSSSGMAFFDEQGQLAQFVGVLQDVTAAVRRRADAEDRALFAEQMVGIVSHDLRNPLSTILMSTYILERGDLSPPLRTVVKRVGTSAERAKRLISDLLDFTQARLGRGLSVDPVPVQLHEVVADSVGELRLAFPGRRIEHVKRGTASCIVDPDRLVQLIGNLVSNAVAYGSPTAPITVTSEASDSQCEIAVHNDGDPIPPALIAGLFEPMVRGEYGSRGGRGVGLGLYIVREIARAHGGRMDVTSSAQQGTTFRAIFPAPAP